MRLYSIDRGIARQEADGALAVLDLPFPDVGALLAEDPSAAVSARVSSRVDIGEVGLRPLIARPGKILAVGLNYPSHADEARQKFASIGRPDVVLPNEPNIQIVAGSAVCAANTPIVLPTRAPGHVDYEGELAVVIGRAGARIPVAHAWEHIAGFSIINDVSARDIQQRAYSGDPAASISVAKSFDTFKPLGPCLVTPDEFAGDVRLRTRVNEEHRQDDRTSEMMYSIPELISYASRFQTLEPGDVIATGSPRGAGQFIDTYLVDGDTVVVEIEGIGALRNLVRSA